MNEIMHGIDVSRYQGDIDWQMVAGSGRQFAIVKGGSIIYGTPCEDRMFNAHMDGALAAGLHVGMYIYAFALNEEEARQEAGFALQLAARYRGKLDMFIAYDVEDSTIAHLSSDQLAANIRAFQKEIEEAGHYCVLYASKYWLEQKIDMAKLCDLDVWVPQWDTTCTYTGNYGMWQYSSSGSIPGIVGRVDEDIAYKDYPNIKMTAAPPTSAPSQTGTTEVGSLPAAPIAGKTRYTVQLGDDLTAIAARYGSTAMALAAANDIENPNLIYPGQVLNIPKAGSVTYTVVDGDTLSAIAGRFGTTYQALAAQNGIIDPDLIYPGQKLHILL